MKKINVLHLINSMDPGGAENLLKFQIPYYNLDEFDIHIGYLIGDGSLLQNENKIKVVDFSSNGKFNYLSIFKIRQYIKKNDIQILHQHLIQSNILGKLILPTCSKTISISTRHYAHSKKDSRLINKIEKKILRFDDKIICISNYVKEYLRKIGIPNNKLEVIYNGVDLSIYEKLTKIPEQYFTIGTIGRLDIQKGIDTLLYSFKKVLSQKEFIKLEVIGEGPLKTEYINLSKELGLSQNVTFLGKLKPEEVRQQMRKWNLFVLASRWESFGMVLIEAAAMGLPIIATNVEAIPEIIDDGKNGLLINPDSPQELYEKIMLFLSGEINHNEIIKNSKANVSRNFSMSEMVDKTQQLYNNIINESY